MVSRRAPWAVAMTTDFFFRSYLEDADHLGRSLPGISAGACTILKKIFRLEPRSRISLADLQREISELESFFSDELSPESSSRHSPALQRSISSLGSTPSNEIGALRIDDDDDIFLVTRDDMEAGVTDDDSLAHDPDAIRLVERPVSAPEVAYSQFAGDERDISSAPPSLREIRPSCPPARWLRRWTVMDLSHQRLTQSTSMSRCRTWKKERVLAKWTWPWWSRMT